MRGGLARSLSSQRVRIGLAALVLAASASPPRAAETPPLPPGIDPSIAKIEVTLDLPKDKPYVGEMIILKVRAFVRAFILLDQLRQPTLTNFDWQHTGQDRPVEAMVDGFRVSGIERDIAIFPQQAGRLIIDPFVRHVTISMDDGRRVIADFASKPIFVDVQNHNGIGAPDAWWLPAKSLTITDEWSVPPDEIKPGTLARRTINVEAVGLTADRLPPPPKMIAAGTLTFKGPAKRETIITPDGPIARASYVFDIRPVSGSPAKMPAIHMPWFDTTERRMRDAVIPDLWVAYVGTLVHASHEKAQTLSQLYLSRGPIMLGLAGFAWTGAVAALLLTARRKPRGARLHRARALRALGRHARFADEPRFRKALTDLAAAEPELWPRVASSPLVASRLAALDSARYGREPGKMPPLRPLAADIRCLFTEFAQVEDTRDTLPALDGTPRDTPTRGASRPKVWGKTWGKTWGLRLARFAGAR